MTNYTDLEIRLKRQESQESGSYSVELRAGLSDSDTIPAFVGGPAPLDLTRLLTLDSDDQAYGQLLSTELFADPNVKAEYLKAQTIAQTTDTAMRVRLFIDPGAPELHDLRWEKLRNPQDGSAIATNQRVLFSRILNSNDLRKVQLPRKGDLRALVAIASPSDLSTYKPGGRQLEPLDVAGELARARSGLAGIPVSVLASGAEPASLPTLKNLIARLQDGCDILYLVCHGALIDGKPTLYLVGEHGKTQAVPGNDLVTRIGELDRPPRLVVLASCQSAGSGDDAHSSDEGALAALGPRLTETSVPAVVAMQGNVTVQTAAAFMQVFLKQLQMDGRIDRAMAVARGAVSDRPDCWMPVLFMRLRSGRIWYVPGFTSAGERAGFDNDKWDAVINDIKQKHCTPILGSGLLESLLGPGFTRDVARQWAETYYFPMAPHEREDLPQVAQFLAVKKVPMFPRDMLVEHLRQRLQQRFGDNLPTQLKQDDAPLEGLIRVVGRRCREQNPAEAHKALADLPFPVYITTNANDLLADALEDVGRAPKTELCRWNQDVTWPASIYHKDNSYYPSDVQPLVYKLFGYMEEAGSIVLTEDDYFDFLIGVTRDHDRVPPVVLRALTDNGLLFLGFQMDDWDFRVLFRSIMSLRGGGRRQGRASIAVQIDPEGGSQLLEPERAKFYLERYFLGENIDMYWGSVEDFLKELRLRWDASRAKNR